MMKRLIQRQTCRNFDQQQSELCEYFTTLCYNSHCRISLPFFHLHSGIQMLQIFSKHQLPDSKIPWCCWIQSAWVKRCWSGCRCWSEYWDLQSSGRLLSVVQTRTERDRRDGRGIIWIQRSRAALQEKHQIVSQRKRTRSHPRSESGENQCDSTEKVSEAPNLSEPVRVVSPQTCAAWTPGKSHSAGHVIHRAELL